MTTLERIINNGGATLDASTLDDTGLKTGYYVALSNLQECKIPIAYIDDGILQRICKRIASELPSYFVGVWVDGGFLYIEPSEWVYTLKTALRKAKVRNQLAIWDIANACEIRL